MSNHRQRILTLLFLTTLPPPLLAEDRKTETFDSLDLAEATVVEFNQWNGIQRTAGAFESHGVRWTFEATGMKPEWAIDGPGLVIRGTLRASIPAGLDELSLRYRGVYEPAAVEVWLNGRKAKIEAPEVGLGKAPGRIVIGREEIPRGELELVIKPVHWCLIDDLSWRLAPPEMRTSRASADGTGIEVRFSRDHGLERPRPRLLVEGEEEIELPVEGRRSREGLHRSARGRRASRERLGQAAHPA